MTGRKCMERDFNLNIWSIYSLSVALNVESQSIRGCQLAIILCWKRTLILSGKPSWLPKNRTQVMPSCYTKKRIFVHWCNLTVISIRIINQCLPFDWVTTDLLLRCPLPCSLKARRISIKNSLGLFTLVKCVDIKQTCTCQTCRSKKLNPF